MPSSPKPAKEIEQLLNELLPEYRQLVKEFEERLPLSQALAMLSLTDAVQKLTGPALSEMRRMEGRLLPNGAVDRHYCGRVEAGYAVASYERQILEVIESHRPARSYHEIGGGIGIVPIALGLMGYTAVNIDGAPTRIEHGEQILKVLAKGGDPSLPERVKMVCSWVPEAFSAVETVNACAICTNMAAPRPQEFIDDFLRQIQAKYTAFIFDLCTLWGTYRTAKEWQAHEARISAVWGRRPELLFARDDYERYCIVKF